MSLSAAAVRRPLIAALATVLSTSGLALGLVVAGPASTASAAQPTNRVVGVWASNASSALLTSGGEVYTWGDNAEGQTGQGTMSGVTASPTKVPNFPPAGRKVVQVSHAGLGGTTNARQFTLALLDNGDLYSWGSDLNGALGNDTALVSSATPVLVSPVWGNDKPALISSAADAAAVVTQSGKFYGWGINDNGQTGVDNATGWVQGNHVPVPTLVSALDSTADRFVELVGTTGSMLARTQSGKVIAWGDRTRGKRGDGYGDATETYYPAPSQIAFPGLQSGETIADIGAGTGNLHAITSTGRVYGWGIATGGRLGNNVTGGADDVLTPTIIPFTAADAGDRPAKVLTRPNGNAALIATQQGHLYVAGQDSSGSTGTGQPQDGQAHYVATFTKITSWPGRPANDPIVAAANSSSKMFAVTQSGRTYAWGNGNSGFGGGGLGFGDNVNVTTPKLLADTAPDPVTGTAPTITGASTATGTKGQSFSYATTSNGDPAPTRTVSGTVPPGVGFNAANGTLSGTPTTAGTYATTITATNASGTASVTVTITIADVFTGFAPTVSGTTSVGQTLSASPGASFAPSGAGTVLTYQWQRYAGSTPVNIASATGPTYDVTAADQGNRLRVLITATRSGYASSTQSSAQTEVVGNGTFSIGPATITGTAVVGGSLTCSVPAGTAGSISYAWTRGATARATGATYSPVAADQGSPLTCTATSVRAGYDDATASANSSAIGPGTFSIGAPTITPGPARVGQTLTCTPAAGSTGTLSFTWAGIAGTASGATYTPVPTDAGNVLTCAVRAVRDGYDDATNQTSTAPVAKGSFTIGAPTISGTARVGRTLTCAAANGPGSASYRWLRGTTQVGSDAAYQPVAADRGEVLTCIVTVSRDGYDDASASANSDVIGFGTFAFDAPTISGTAATGRTLTCAAPAGTPGTLSYAWTRASTSIGSDAAYVVKPADVGASLTCTATSTRAGYEPATNLAASDVVALGTFTLEAPTVEGLAQVDRTLTCVAPTGPGTPSYRWLRGTTQVGTGASYDVAPVDVDSTLTCKLTVTRDGYVDATSTSEPTAAVARASFSSGPVAGVTGTPVVDGTLDVSVGASQPAADSYSYAWSADGTPIADADGDELTLTPGLVGKKITATVTAVRDGYVDATNTSTPTAAVARASFSSGPVAGVTGTPVVDGTLEVSVGASQPAADSYSYAWSADGTPIADADGDELTLTPGLVGKKITATVTAVRDGYVDATSTSTPTAAVARAAFTTAPKVSLTGTPVVDGVFTASVAAPSPAGTYTYAWFADGRQVAGANGDQLTLTPELVGNSITVEVTASRDGYVDATATSAASAAVARASFATPPAAAVSGTAQVGQVLSATTGPTTPAATAYQFAWFADDTAIPTANGETLLLTPAHRGHRISVVVTATRNGYSDASTRSGSTATVVTNLAPAVQLTIHVPTGAREEAVTPDGRPTIRRGRQATVTWTSQGDASLSATGPMQQLLTDTYGTSPVPANGSIKVRIDRNGLHTFQMVASNELGSTSASASIVAVRAPTRLTVQAPATAKPGKTIRLRIEGLGFGERYVVTVAGQRISRINIRASANPLVRRITLPRTLKAGKVRITVTGRSTQRTGTATIRIR